jgi:hypothetical protein
LEVPIDGNLNFIGTNSCLPEYIYNGEPDTVKIYKEKITEEWFKNAYFPASLEKLKKLEHKCHKPLYGDFLTQFLYDDVKKMKERGYVSYKMEYKGLKPGDNLDFMDNKD